MCVYGGGNNSSHVTTEGLYMHEIGRFTAKLCIVRPLALERPATVPILALYAQRQGFQSIENKLSYRRDTARRLSLRCSMSFKVTDFSTNRKHAR